MTTLQHETTILRELAHQVKAAAAHLNRAERIRLWTDHNSLAESGR